MNKYAKEYGNMLVSELSVRDHIAIEFLKGWIAHHGNISDPPCEKALDLADEFLCTAYSEEFK